MKRLFILAASIAAAALAVPAAATASNPHVESDSVAEGVRVHQEITVWGRDTMHYVIGVQDPTAARPAFCMTFQFERKTAAGWRRAGGREGRDHACCPDPTPDETCDGRQPGEAGWGLFLYPRRSLRDDVLSGRLRMRGFSDYGPSIVLRLDGPLL